MCIQEAECRVRNFCDALDFDEQWCRTSGLFPTRCLAGRAANAGRARASCIWVGNDEKRINTGPGHCRVGKIGLEELCFDVLDELVKVSVRIKAELGREPA